MKSVLGLVAFLASSSAFAFTTGTYQCSQIVYQISDSGVMNLPYVEIKGFNNSVLRGIAQVTETVGENNAKVETIKYNLGARTLQIEFVDGKTSCKQIN